MTGWQDEHGELRRERELAEIECRDRQRSEEMNRKRLIDENLSALRELDEIVQDFVSQAAREGNPRVRDESGRNVTHRPMWGSDTVVRDKPTRFGVGRRRTSDTSWVVSAEGGTIWIKSDGTWWYRCTRRTGLDTYDIVLCFGKSATGFHATEPVNPGTERIFLRALIQLIEKLGMQLPEP